MDEFDVPESGRIIWATPEAVNKLKLDENFIGNNSLAQGQVKFKGQVGEIDGKPIIKTRKKFLAEGVSMIIAHPSAVMSPLKIEEATIHSNPPGIAGHLMEALVYFDAFVIEGREGCIATITKKVATPTPPVDDKETGGASGKTVKTTK